ncbi:SpoIIE family protein phosphatase [bacterium]|nr:SpoIIE family protein phosphatase [bacterium]
MKIIPTILLIFIITFITSLSFAQNRVLSLNGEGDYVEIPATSSFALQDFTISFFVNPKAQNEDIVTLIDYNHKEETGNWVIQTLDAMDTNMWAMGYRSGVMNQWQPRFQGYNNAPFTEGVWQHIAFVKQSDKVFTYKNGFLIHTRVDEDPTVKYTTPAPLYFGHWNRGGRFFNGLLDEVRIFNYACTQEEIRKTMHTTLSGTEPGLVGYWRFDDIGKVATDLSKGRSDGKLMGDARFAEAEFPEPGELVIPTVLSGIISDGEGRPIPNTSVRLEKKEEIAQTQTDASGSYWISIFEPVIGVYDLSATKGELGGWQLNFRLREGEHRKLNLMLAKAISIEGTLLMLDDKAPHVAVPVQAIHNGEVIATVLSDENGKYQFINLKPEKYQVRCQVLNGYIYYGSSSISKNMELRENDREESPSLPSSNTITERERLEVKSDTSLANIDFRFAPFKKGVWKTYKALDGLADNHVYAIYRTSDGVMWFGTSGGASCYDGNQFVNLTVKDGLVNNKVLSIYGDPDGIMWFGTAGGVSRYDGNQFINFTTKDGLGDNVVNAIHRDPDGVMWFGMGSRWASEIGVFRGGVSRYYGNQFINFTTKDGLASNTVTAIHCAPDSVMWFGTSEGVSRYDGNQFVNFTTKDGLLSNDVRSIDSDPDGVMWFGTYRPFGEGESVISRYDGNQFVTLTNGLYVYRAPDGVMWFGLWGGVSRYDGKELVTFTPKDGLVDGRFVTTIYGDSDGVMWFGTGGGVSRYNGKEFKNFTTEDGLAGNIISDIHRDTDSTIWFATEDGGVSRYDGRNFINFTKEDGLASNNVHAICETSDGMMWFGTSGGGVSCYDGTVWTSLDTRDGLAGNSVNSIQQDLEGYLWFGTIDGGITRYRRSTVSPKVRIVSVRTDKLYMLDRHTEKSLQAIPTITTNRLVTIKYTALDFKTIPEKQQYRCRIRKIDQDWRRPTKSTYFDYTFNKTGTYVFEVQAIDRDLNYSEPASLTLKIVPPFYLRAGFLIPVVGFGLILIAVLTIVSIGYIKRHRQVQAYQQEAVRELQDANRIQMSLMPDTSPPIAGVEIAGKCLPANTVSGDFFDYLESKQPNEIALVVADVTGKAMKGAMNAVMADGVLRMAAEEMENLSSASLMMKVNNVLTGSMEWGMNITMVIGTIDTDTQNLTLANAAHHAYPLLFRNGEVQVLKTGGLPLGMRARIQYSEEQFQLQSGDVVFFMTDGIIEAQDNEGKMYSDSGRLEETIAQFTLEQNAEAMVEAIINDAIDFGGARESRDDDMTVVVVKIK